MRTEGWCKPKMGYKREGKEGEEKGPLPAHHKGHDQHPRAKHQSLPSLRVDKVKHQWDSKGRTGARLTFHQWGLKDLYLWSAVGVMR